ncbi:MAG: sulfotransferase family 2 domain-containing protein [Pseudomonadota bacterium]
MPYIIPRKKLAVFFSPKCAGTSIRTFLFHVENGFPFRPFKIQGQSTDENTMVRNLRFNLVKHRPLKDYTRLAVVRDPVRRLVSGYSNRVLHYKELSEKAAGEKLAQEGLAPDPDIDTFFANIDGYRRASGSIQRHTKPQKFFVGPEKSYYDRVYTIEELGTLVEDVNARFGTEAEMPRLQTGGPKFKFEELAPETQANVLAFARDDVMFDWFPEWRARYPAL